LEGSPILARPTSAFEKWIKKARRHKGITITAMVAAFVLLIGGVISLLVIGRMERRSDEETARKIEAESGRDKAERLLEKNRKVAKVLLGAYMKLGRIHGELKKTFYATLKRPEEKRAEYELHRGEIERFLSGVEGDPASQATRFAVEGWLKWLGDFETKSLALFARGRETDGEVGWGYLFEAMAWLSRYFHLQEHPEIITSDQGIEFTPVPPETEEMKAIRARFEDLIGEAGKAAVWGAGSAEAFQEVLDAFRGMQDQDLKKTETGLTKALALTETAWMEEEILIARMRTRLPLRDFDGGIRDAEALRNRNHDTPETGFALGALLVGRSTQCIGTGEDPRPFLRKAIVAYEGALEKSPDNRVIRLNWGTLHSFLGDAESRRGADPREHYRKAIAILEGLRGKRGTSDLLPGNLARAYASLGKTEGERGGNPLPLQEKAIQILDRYLEEKPDHFLNTLNRAKTHLDLGRALAERGKDPAGILQKALEDCGKAIRLDPNQPAAYVTRGDIHLALSKQDAHSGRDPKPHLRGAVESCTEALRRDPKSWTARYIRAEAFKDLAKAAGQAGDPSDLFQRALEDCRQALEAHPRSASAYNHLANTRIAFAEFLRKRGQDPREKLHEALKDIASALECKPGDFSVYNNRGLAHLALGEAESARGADPVPYYRKAVADFEACLRSHPAYGAGHSNLGAALLRLGSAELLRGGDPRTTYRRAIEILEKALALKPGDPKALGNRGNVYLRLGQTQFSRGEDPQDAVRKAVSDFSEALRRRPGFLSAFNGRGGAWLLLGEAERSRGQDPRTHYRKAIADYEEGLRRDPTQVILNINLGNTFMKIALAQRAAGGDPAPDFEKALSSIEEGLKRMPRYWKGYFNKGTVLELMGRFPEAQQAYEEGVRRTGGRVPLLRDALSRARTLAASPPWLSNLILGDTSIREGDYAGAERLCRQGLQGAEKAGARRDPNVLPLLANAEFNLACISALASVGKRFRYGKPAPPDAEMKKHHRQRAFAHLKNAVELGWKDWGRLRKDPLLDPLRDLSEFKTFVRAMEEGAKKE
jgi:tetratricopeptide (TPR) repeat protein